MKKLLCLFALLVGLSTASFASTTSVAAVAPVASAAQKQVNPTVFQVASKDEAVALATNLTAGKAAKVAVVQEVMQIVLIDEDGNIIIITITF
jgi:hypothetical protein